MKKRAPHLHPLRIGLSAGHQEMLDLSNPVWRTFAAVLDSLPVERLTLSESLNSAPLHALDALLIGAPTTPLAPEEITAVKRWVDRGGRLLRMTQFGADHTDLPIFQPGLSTMGHPLVAPVEQPIESPPTVTLRHPVDATALLGRSGVWMVEQGVLLRSHGFADAEINEQGAGRVWPRGRKWLNALRPLHTEGMLTAAGSTVWMASQHPPVWRSVGSVSDAMIMLHSRHSSGRILTVGTVDSFRDHAIGQADNVDVLLALFHEWLDGLHPREVHRRQAEPQRHRLLQGYPMAPLMRPAQTPAIAPRTERPLIVGILPHPFCNPAVSGCGFCTFPHQSFNKAHATTVAQAVHTELHAALEAHPHLEQRDVQAVYFGGGTANLTPKPALQALCEALATRWSMDGVEVTLEGVPRYFQHQDHALLRVLQETLPQSKLRISMGIQTFSASRLEEMGRTLFGQPDDIIALIETAKKWGIDTSGDLLINLPGQTQQEMRDDIQKAIAAGLDQICLYHLVLFAGLGTPWSTDPTKLDLLPSNTDAAANWLFCRQALLEAGYTQTTLTNFERTPRFQYERCSFRPDQYDALGVGPGAISTFSDGQHWTKWLGAEDADAYCARVARGGWQPEQWFAYGDMDARLLWLTRQLAGLSINRAAYSSQFGQDVLDDFAPAMDALQAQHLIAVTETQVCPTPLGMFFADTIAGVLAWPHATALRVKQQRSGTANQAQELDLSKFDRAAAHRMG